MTQRLGWCKSVEVGNEWKYIRADERKKSEAKKEPEPKSQRPGGLPMHHLLGPAPVYTSFPGLPPSGSRKLGFLEPL